MADSTLEDLTDLATKAREARRPFEPAWWVSLAYYEGRQWVFFAGNQLVQPDLDKSTVTDNRIQPMVRTEVAKMLKQRPVWVCPPNTTSDDDANAARFSELLMQWHWDNKHLSRRLRTALNWSRVCGAGFFKACWDPTLGASLNVLINPQGQVITDNNGAPIQATPQLLEIQGAQAQTVAMGDIRIEVKSPFEILPDPLAGEDGIESCEWLIEVAVRSEQYVADRYNQEVTADAEALPGLIESNMRSANTQYKGVKIFEYWRPPSSSQPKGRRAVFTNNLVLYEGGCEYTRLPYIMLPGIPIPGRFWPTSVVEQSISPQTELNKTLTQIRENQVRVGNPALLQSRQARTDQYTGDPGQVITYDDTTPNSIPRWLETPSLPPYILQQIEVLQQSLMEISGQHEVSSATVPAGVTAASAISLLQEQDDTRLGPDTAELEAAISKLGSMILELSNRYYSDDRKLRIAGGDGDWQILDFNRAMMRGHTGIEVQAGSMFPKSQAAKQAWMQQILNLFVQNGIPLDSVGLRKAIRDLGLGASEHMIANLTNDLGQINRENARLASGQPLQINSYDNHQLHIAQHEEFQKTSRYDQLNPGTKALVEQHVAAHRQQLLAETGPPPAPGMPGLPGAPTGPGNPVVVQPSDQAGMSQTNPSLVGAQSA